MNDLFETYPTAASAYREVVENCHDLANWQPSHPVVFETGRRIGIRAIRMREKGAGALSFKRLYSEVCNAYSRGERFVDTKPKAVKYERVAPQQRAEFNAIANSNLHMLRAALGE